METRPPATLCVALRAGERSLKKNKIIGLTLIKKISSKHEHWMKLALGLARNGEGLTRPNPPVGALIIKNGRIVGAGFHHRAGEDHAEIIALKKASARARNASMYVTLEPCSTFGKTPPCVNAIIKSGIKEVIIATRDPNPRHQGRGIVLLKKAGIKVVEGVCGNEAQKFIAPFKKWILTGHPYVSLKLAMSFDGKIADWRGHSRWITGKQARLKVHDLRRRVDAVLVGAGTILADAPSLLPKPAHNRRPYRIILDAKGRIPLNANILRDNARRQTIIATTRQCPAKTLCSWQKAGVQVWILPQQKGLVSTAALTRKIGQLGLLHVLCEGGAELANSFVRAKAVDEFLFFIAPCLIGGKKAKGVLNGNGWLLESAPKLRFLENIQIGKDIFVRARPMSG